MTTKIELQTRIAELETAQTKAEILYQISLGLNKAGDEEELLQTLAQPAQETGAFMANLIYTDLNEAVAPKWFNVIAAWSRENALAAPVGTRYSLSEYPLANLWMAGAGKPQLIADVATDERVDEEVRVLMEQMNIRAAAIIPLVQAKRWIGILAFSWKEPHQFSRQEAEIYHAFIDLVAPAVENRRLAEKARVRAKEQTVLNKLGQALTARLNVEQVLGEAYRGAAGLVDTTNFAIGLYNAEKDEISFPFDTTETDDKHIISIPASHGMNGYVVRNRTSLLIRENMAEWHEERGLEMVGKPALCWLGVPLIIGDRALGALSIQSYTPSQIYNEHDRNLLTAIASQIAIALHNAQLFEETQRRMREVQLLHDVGLAAAFGVRLEETLQAAAETLAAEFDNALVALMLLDKESNTLRLDAGVGYPPGVVGHERISVGTGLVGWVVQRSEPALVPDMSLDSRCINFDKVDVETRSELCVPLIIDAQVIGIINIESVQLNAFTNDDLRLLNTLASSLAVLVERARLVDNLEQIVEERTAELRKSLKDRDRLQLEIIEAQQHAIQELSTPVIPIMDRIIVMPLIGSIDSMRAKDIMRTLLAGIRKHRAKIVILDITGVAIVDSGVAGRLDKTIQAARLKGAQTIITGISDAVAETIVDLGIDWSGLKTLSDLQTGLIVALSSLSFKLDKAQTN